MVGSLDGTVRPTAVLEQLATQTTEIEDSQRWYPEPRVSGSNPEDIEEGDDDEVPLTQPIQSKDGSGRPEGRTTDASQMDVEAEQ